MKSFTSPSFASPWPLMLDGFRPALSARAHERPQGKGRKGGSGPPLYEEEEERVEQGFRVVENYVGWRMSILPPGGVGEPLVCLPSALATELAPLAVLGIWNARKAKGKGRLVGRRAGLE